MLRRRLGIDLLKDLRKYESEFPKDLIGNLRKLKDLSFDDEDKYNDRYYTKSDFINTVGIEIEDTDKEQTNKVNHPHILIPPKAKIINVTQR